jgi:hypothetical protein
MMLGPPRPKATVAKPVIDFGTMPENTEGRATWIVKNDGNGPLRLTLFGMEGGWTKSPLKLNLVTTISPREERRLVLCWNTYWATNKARSDYWFSTNDPDQPIINLAVEGVVAPSKPAVTGTS